MKFLNFKNKNKYIKAKTLLDDGDFKNSLKLFNVLLNKNYEVFSVLFNLITIHNKLNSLDILLNQIDELLTDDSYNRVELLIHKGYIFYLKKNYKNAIQCFDEVLNIDSNNLWAYFYKYKVNYELKENLDLCGLFNRIKTESVDYYLLFLVGEFFLELNMLDKSLFCLNESIKKYPEDSLVWRDKGMILNLLEKYPEAISAFNNSLKLKNDFIVWDLKGRTYYCMNDYNNSLKSFNQSLKLNPNNLKTLKNKMILLSEMGDLEESLTYCNKILQIDEEDINVWNFKLDILQKLNKYEELNLFHKKALKKFNKNPNLKKINDIQ